MKRFAIPAVAAALALAATGSAFAMTSSGLSARAQFEVMSAAPDVDLSTLSRAQINALENLLISSDDNGAGDFIDGRIRAIISNL
jgi:hypothetical protein